MAQPPMGAFGTSAFGALQRFVRRNNADERCELCGAGLAAEHEHLLEPANRRLVCSCQACAILFPASPGQVAALGGPRYKRVPRRIRFLPDFQLTDTQWEGLLVPINMAFFLADSVSGKAIAIYPSPAGAIESQLPIETWDEITAGNPLLQSMEADVEALLVNRLGAGRGFATNQYFLLPVDQCFKLVGVVRTHWRGLSGGDELWRELGGFFATLTALAGFTAGSHYA